MHSVQIAPSILSCNFLHLEQEIKDVEKAGADLIHIDIMDGHFVPNITIGPMIVKSVKKVARTPLDVHLMITHPEKFITDFIEAGADIVTIHAEADCHIFRTIDIIKSKGRKAGVSLNPSTPLSSIEYILEELDLLLIMTVNPGFGGQKYISSMEPKIKKARTMIEKTRKHIDLEVDGGIKATNVKKVIDAGANIIVMGTEIFHSGNYKKKIQEIRKIVRQ